MRVLILYAHPHKKSFNHAMLQQFIAGLTSAGHEIKVKDLYAENFDPILTEKDLAYLQAGKIPTKIQQEQDALSWAEGLAFIYPLWWFGTPAILKGWFDCTLTYGYAFGHEKGKLQGLLQHKKALFIVSAGNKEKWFKANNTQELIHRPIMEGTLEFCGINDIDCHIIYNASALSEQERKNTLNTIYNMGYIMDFPPVNYS